MSIKVTHDEGVATVLLDRADKLNALSGEIPANLRFCSALRRLVLHTNFFSGPLPEPGTEITLDGQEAGEIRSVVPDGDDHATGLAMIRLNRLDQAFKAGLPLMAGEATVVASRPDWATF